MFFSTEYYEHMQPFETLYLKAGIIHKTGLNDAALQGMYVRCLFELAYTTNLQVTPLAYMSQSGTDGPGLTCHFEHSLKYPVTKQFTVRNFTTQIYVS